MLEESWGDGQQNKARLKKLPASANPHGAGMYSQLVLEG